MDQEPTVDRDDRAGDVRGVVGREEADGRGLILGLCEPPDRDLASSASERAASARSAAFIAVSVTPGATP